MTVRTRASFAEASTRIREALKAQGFGVLTEIDVQATLRDRLGENMEEYIILGAYQRGWAARALLTAQGGYAWAGMGCGVGSVSAYVMSAGS